jgi:hypothetical protein
MPLRKNYQVFPRVYNATDFGLTANVVCQPSQYSIVGKVTVPYGQQVTFGVGGVGAVDTRAVAYINLWDTSGAAIDGKIRLSLTDPNQVQEIVIAEQRTERFRASQTDINNGFRLGEYPIKAGEQSLLLIKLYPDSATAVTIKYDGSNTKILMPVTVLQ